MYQKLETHDLTDDQLHESYWIVTHWKKILHAIIVGLSIFNILLVLFVLGFVVKMYLIDRNFTIQFVDGLKQSVGVAPQPSVAQALSLDSVTVLPTGKGRSDLVATVTNPNKEWRAQFDIVYLTQGEIIGVEHAFVYPEQKKYVMSLGSSFSGPASDMTAEVRNVFWQRMTENDAQTISERRQFAVSEFSFASSAQPSVGTATFSLANASAYSYWNVPVPVVLFSGSRITAAKRITIDHLDKDEARKLQVAWYQELPSPSSFVIEPDVDIFDASVYRSSTPPLQKLR
ncbi:MAG: hypothetical protein Q7S47_00085 [bacterium]|nr:hypothetical protein [bacterium]